MIQRNLMKMLLREKLKINNYKKGKEINKNNKIIFKNFKIFKLKFNNGK